MNNRYWLFYSRVYYPEGGIEDRIGAYASIEESKTALKEKEGYLFDSEGLLVSDTGDLEEDAFAYVFDVIEDQIVVGKNLEQVGKLVEKIRYLQQYGLEQYRRGRQEEPSDYIKKRAKY